MTQAARATDDLGVPTKVHSRDPATLKPLIADMLSAQFPGRDGLAVTHLEIPGGGGVNNETLLLDLTWSEGGGAQTGGAVLRLESEDTLFPEPSFAAHYRLYELMNARAAVPVPRVWGLGSVDSPLGRAHFFMERLDGRVPPDQPPFHGAGWVHDLSAEARRAMWEDAIAVMARLHETPLEDVAFLDRPALGGTGVEQELHFALRYMDWALAGDSNRVLAAAARWLQDNLPADTGGGLSWGDARPQNLIFREDRVVGLFDWDMASLAGPEADFAWWTLTDLSNTVSRGVPRLPGWGSPAQSMSRWEDIRGRRLRHMDWHFVFAAFRLGVILMRLAKMLDARGLLPERSQSWKDNNTGIQYCASLIGVPPLSADSLVWPGPDA